MDPQDIYTALLEPAGMDDPYPLYAALQQHGQVVTVDDDLVLVPGYEAANSVLRDPEFLVDDAEAFDLGYPDWRDHPVFSLQHLLSLNGADHRRIRGLLARHLTARRVRALEPVIDRLAADLLDAMAEHATGGRAIDFMAEFAFALPVAVICELIGVSEWDKTVLRPLSRDLNAVLEPEIDDDMLARADSAAVTLTGMFAQAVADRQAHARGDLISELVAVADRGEERITEQELIQNLILLLTAGFECSTNMLGNGMRILLTEPSARDDLRSGSVAPAEFVEEVLRYDGPVQDTGRRRRAPGQIAGVPVDADAEVVILLGAANRDPRRFARPDAFWPQRPDSGSLSFGSGVHACLGAALARLQGTRAFPRLLGRFPDLAPAGEPERRYGATFRGFERMPVDLCACSR